MHLTRPILSRASPLRRAGSPLYPAFQAFLSNPSTQRSATTIATTTTSPATQPKAMPTVTTIDRRNQRASLRDKGRAGDDAAAIDAIRSHAITAASRDALNRSILDRIPPDARFVLFGEASHGTEEFYDQRAELTQLLIQERGFTAVLVESDWPDAFRVNRYVRGLPRRVDGGGLAKMGAAGDGEDRSAVEALGDYQRFPRWMWHNRSVASFAEWLRNHNLTAVHPGADSATHAAAAAARCGFYGMDVYSLHTSADAVLRYLRETDPQAARVVEARYRCFDRYGADAQSYGLATAIFHKASCEDSVNRALMDIRRRVDAYRNTPPDGPATHEEALALEANAMVVSGAEAYYRNMFTRDEITWNLRDSHFFSTVQLVERHLERLQRLAAEAESKEEKVEESMEEKEGKAGGQTPQARPKMVLWAHNSHLGDARQTDAGWHRGQLNIGQLVRQAYGQEAFLVGFTTHTGHVTAADEWGEAAQHKAVNPSLPGSYENLMHRAASGASAPSAAAADTLPGAAAGGPQLFALDLRTPELAEALQDPLLERAIGVIYRPDTELQSHYFDAVLPRQFDMVIHAEVTSAVEPLEPGDEWAREPRLAETHGDMPELWPSGV